jgi:hypothetical protein
MRPIVVTTTGISTSSTAVMDHYQSPFNVGMGVVVTAPATYTIQHTFDDVLNASVTPTWFNHPTLSGSSSADGNYAFPVRGIRINQTAGAGSVALTIIQAGMPGK